MTGFNDMVLDTLLHPSSDLWDLVVDMDWPRVIEHAQQHPRDAAYVDGHYDESVLYLCCQHNPPLEAVQAIRRAYPVAVTMNQSRKQRALPIHVACRNQLSEVILQELLEDHPETAMGYTGMERTPIVELWEARCRQEKRLHRQAQALQQRNGENDNEEAVSSSSLPLVAIQDDKEFWRKVLLLLKNIYFCSQENQYENGVAPLAVHSAVFLGARGCPIQVLRYVLRHFPEQTRTRDQKGRLPLHVAVGPTPATSCRQYLPREKEMITALLCENPQAACLPECEQSATLAPETNSLELCRLPLVIALSNLHTWSGGIADLVAAAPSVLLRRDPVTKLYPFQIAATSSTNADLDTIYNLLRIQPEVMNLLDLTPRGRTPPLDSSARDVSSPWNMANVVSTAVVAMLIGIVIAHQLEVTKPRYRGC